jgi:gliding motility-associated-like protein
VKLSDIGKNQIVNVAEVSANSASGISSGLMQDTAHVTINDCELLIPEIFSPNGDGNQDYFRVFCIEKYPDAKIEVYNRWGNLVFTKEHFGNTSVWGETDAWWDGYSDHKWTAGKEKLPPATYYYILFLNDGSKPRNGFIFLNR